MEKSQKKKRSLYCHNKGCTTPAGFLNQFFGEVLIPGPEGNGTRGPSATIPRPSSGMSSV